MTESIIIALSISLINALIAVLVLKKAVGKSPAEFTKLAFGSMVIRYFLVSVSVFICLKFYVEDLLSFGLTFLISTFLLIFFEIFYLVEITKKQSKQNK